ncbi:MAG: (2Fe-2S)-binding protein [Deltaproteobacteria bacterium]|nr:(2Fe-2S)-binding protein [Deltaproteobacteria bacterium]
MASVRVLPTGRELTCEPGRSLLDVLLDHREPIATSCGGVAACGMCRLRVDSGAAALNAVDPRETQLIGNLLVQQGWRLACQARLTADASIAIEVPPPIDSAGRKQAKWTRMQRQRQSERRARRPSSGTSKGRPSSGTSKGRPSSGTSQGRGRR